MENTNNPEKHKQINEWYYVVKPLLCSDKWSNLFPANGRTINILTDCEGIEIDYTKY